MNFSAWAIRKPIPAILLFIMLTAVGLLDFNRLKVQDFPDIEFPVVTVTVTLPGAIPSQLETEVTRRVEDAVANVGSVNHITSTVTEGLSLTAIEFDIEKDVNEAVDDVRDAVDQIRSDLPSDIREPIVSRINVSSAPIITYSVVSDRLNEAELSWFVDHDVSKAVLGAPGVGRVSRIGGIDRQVTVEIDPDRLQSLNLTVSDVSQALRAIQQEVSSGRGNVGAREQSVRTLGTVQSVDDLRNIYIPLKSGGSVRLDQVASIRDEAGERTQLAMLDGKPVVSFEIYRSKGESEVSVGAAVDKVLEALEAANPDIRITEVSSTIGTVQESYDSSMKVLYEGAALAVIVVFLFLKDIRATLISAVALPLSILPTFAAMYWFGFSLNVVTLLSLSLVVGILVDDAIVEIENIVRHLRMGKPPLEAAIEAADEIGMAVIATTFTLVSVFLPTAFMGGIAGKFFIQFGWTAALAILFSLLVARLLTPMMAAYLLKPQPEHTGDGWLMKRYLAMVHWCVIHRRVTILGATLFFIASIWIASLLPANFIPPSEQGRIQMAIELPPGSRIDDTQAVAEQVRGRIKDVDGVAGVYTAIGAATGGGGPGQGASTGAVRKATILVLLTPKGDRPDEADIQAMLRERLKDIPGVRISLGSGQSGEKVTTVLSGDDPDTLDRAALAVAADMRGIPELSNVTSSASALRPEIVIVPDFAKAAALGVTTQAIGDTVRVATAGDYDVSLPKFNLPEQQLYIMAKLPETARADLDTLRQLRVPSSGGYVQLGNVASLHLDSGPSQIDRYDRSRNVTISAELGGAALSEISAKIDALPSMKNLPPGVRQAASGDLEQMQELFGSFGLAMLTGVLCVLCVLILLFHDFFQPVTILSALPLSAGGAFGLLYLTGHGMSMPTLIGLLMLMGIVTKNSILLVEYAIVARHQRGLGRFEALMDACHKRAQPILMTTIAMTAGMIPIALGLEGDASFRAPMAVAVIGGLITSTLLSLLVVPAVYTYVDDIEHWVKRRFSRAPAE